MIDMILPLLGQVLLLGVLISMVPVGRSVSLRYRVLILTVLLAFCVSVPIQGLTIGQWFRSVLGDLSVLMLVVLVDILARKWMNRRLIPEDSRIKLMSGVLIVGVVFYPLSLGLGSFDPYRLGFLPFWFSALIALLAFMTWITERHVLAIALLLPLLAFNLHMLESDNLWDYLIDPVLFSYALVQTASLFKGRISK